MKPSFLAFFLKWAERQRWDVPDIHVQACHWFEHRGELAVFRCFRGFGKSTMLDVYNAWRIRYNPRLRMLHQSESDPSAYKASRDTQHILRAHPWCQGVLPDSKMSVESWWTPPGLAHDPRNPTFHARGITSNVTGARADEIQNDDVEVPRNIRSPEARELLRYRLGEQVHIAVPGAPVLFVGTPHTHDSIYDEQEKLGADCLTIRLFEHEHRIENATERFYPLPFVPEFIFAGIGKPTRLLEPGTDYRLSARGVHFSEPPGTLLDFYSGCAWPERFDRKELLKRRRRTRTVNEWDSQYQLHSKPISETRLDPARLVPYDAELVLEHGNRQVRLMLGKAQIISARAYWDISKGLAGNDTSALCLILDDLAGNQYWHAAECVTGDLTEFEDSANGKITGGQALQIAAFVKRFHIPALYVETNGIGAFVPTILKRALRQEGVTCGVIARQVGDASKNARILAAIEPALTSGVLWAHARVIETVQEQMREWNPALKNQPDDYLDAGAGALIEAPVRVGRIAEISDRDPDKDWRPRAGTPEVAYAR